MMKHTWISLFLGFLLLGLFHGKSAESDAGRTEIGSSTLSLSVRDSILMSLENNRSLAVEKYGPDIAETFVLEEGAVFDPVLSTNFTPSKSTGQRTSGVGEFRTVKNQQISGDVGVTKQFPVGLSMDFTSTTRRQDSDVYTTLFSTRLGTTLTLPVLKGFGSDVNLAGVHLAEKDVDLSRYELHGFILALAAQVEGYYWDLFMAREELKIHLSSLELARQQMLVTKDRIDVGEIPEIELAAAEGEVALREKDVIDARSVIEKTTLRFLQAINPPGEDPWSSTIDLVDSFTVDDADWGAVETHVGIAQRNRPDINQARVEYDKQEIQIVRTKNGLLPQLDFFITLGKTGYANTYLDTFSNLKEDNFDASGGFLFSYSFGNRAAKARHTRAQFQEREAKTAVQNFEQLVDLDVRIAFSELDRATQQIAATHKSTQLQDAKYQAEIEKFQNESEYIYN